MKEVLSSKAMWGVGLVLLLSGWEAGAQEVAARPAGPRVDRVAIAARVLSTEEELDPAPPGGVLTLIEGQKVRLRMAAIPAGGYRYARFPGARFTVSANRDGAIVVVRANEERGSLTLEARRPTEDQKPVIHFEVLDPLNMDQGLRTGRIEIEVLGLKAPDPEPEPERDPEPSEKLGVTFYEHGDFRGRSTRFIAGARDLRGSYVGNDSLSSVRVDPGCRLVLYEHQDFRGDSTVLYEDITYLGETRVGNDTASSFELDCADPETRRGVALYDGADFRGTEEIFYADDPDLEDNRIGDDRVRSLRVDRGCTVTLYDLPGYRGRSMVVDRDLSRLRRSEIGDDEVSSLRVDCR